MAMSTFSFFLPLPFFAAAGGFGGAAAFGAFCPFGAFGWPPAAPTKARVLLRSSMAASEARALILIAFGGSHSFVRCFLLARRRNCLDRYRCVL